MEIYKLFYIHCFACMYVCERMLEALKLELQTGMSCHVSAGN